MVIGIMGESCTGKSTIAEKLKEKLNAKVYSGKDYLRFAKNENIAKELFRKELEESKDKIIYIISEKEHLELLPQHTFKILMTADLNTIKERFALRMKGNLPNPVAQMLERKHGCFDDISCDVHIHSENIDLEKVCNEIVEKLKNF